MWYQGDQALVRDANYRWLENINTGEYSFFDDSEVFRPVKLDTNNLTDEQQEAWERLKYVKDSIETAAAEETPFSPDTLTVDYPDTSSTGILDKIGRYRGELTVFHSSNRSSVMFLVPGAAGSFGELSIIDASGNVLYKKEKFIQPLNGRKGTWGKLFWDLRADKGISVSPGLYFVSISTREGIAKNNFTGVLVVK
jgi:hypothetical protein